MDSIQTLHKKLEQKEVSAVELTKSYLERIEQQEPEIHALITTTPEYALTEAQAVDKLIADGKDLPLLAGIPYTLKDAILVKDIRCTAASRMLDQYIAPYDATVAAKLKEQGAVLVGKANMDEFGMGGSTENSAYGPTKNPHDTTKVPGGSSGGSAASVAAHEAVFSLGEDTGGSIRQPAAFCGTVGLKPTYGAVSRNGVIALASSLDQIGPFGNTIADTAAVFQAIAGKDAYDATSVARTKTPRNPIKSFGSLRIGIPKEYFASAGLDAQIQNAIESILKEAETQGAKIIEIEFPHTKYALAAYYIINTSEASANLARYDGIRYGLSMQKNDILETYHASRGKGLGEEVKRRIMLGTFALSAGYYDAYYIKAQKIRTLLKQDFEHAFTDVDIIAAPVTPTLPFGLGERTDDPLGMYLVDLYTVPVNLTGLPGLSMPIAKSKENLPIGLQLIAPAFQEQTLFDVGTLFEETAHY